MNVQAGNVGNLGDILKHGALVQLALALRGCAGDDTCYVETHSYLLQARPADPVAWHSITTRLSGAHSGYETYVEIERPLIDKHLYRCSAGLAQDLLRPARAYLAEQDPATLRTLEAQVISEGLGDRVTLISAADQLPKVIDEKPRRGMLMLVDPFKDPREVWSTVNAIVEGLGHEEMLGAIEVFASGESTVQWPEPPVRFAGPLATMCVSTYQLALYVTKPFEDAALEAVGPLDWWLLRDLA